VFIIGDCMPVIETGRVCIKKYGRDAGERAVITKVLENGYVNIVTATRPKPRRCNVRHLELLVEKVNAESKEEIAKALEIPVEKLKL